MKTQTLFSIFCEFELSEFECFGSILHSLITVLLAKKRLNQHGVHPLEKTIVIRNGKTFRFL